MRGTRVVNWSDHRKAYRALAETTDVMMWLSEADGYCFYLNPQWYVFTGQSECTAEGDGWLEAVHPRDRERAKQSFTTASQVGSGYCVDYRLCRSDESFAWVTAYAQPYLDREGRYEGLIGSIAPLGSTRRVGASDRLPETGFVLTPREREMLQWISLGKSAEEIAAILDLYPRTVEFHLATAAKKLNTFNRIDTLVAAIRLGEIDI